MNTKPDLFVARGYGNSELWLDLVNSEYWDGFGKFTDMLDNPDWVNSFMHHWEFRIPLQEPFPQLEFLSLRALIRTLLEKAARGKKLRLEQLAPLNEWITVPVKPQLKEDQYGLRISFQIDQSGWYKTLTKVAYSFARCLIDQGQRRLRICQNQGCRWIFIDKSKGNVRRWCNTATCGNRERVRKARAAEKH